MPIQFSCPHCGNATEVSDQYAGQSGPCAKCGEAIDIPASSASTPAHEDVATPPVKQGSAVKYALIGIGSFLAFGCVCMGAMVALLMPAVHAAREAARRASCVNNEKQIAFAMQNHHDAHGHLPNNTYAEDGAEMQSWRTQILPFLYMEELRVYGEYNQEKPWSAPENAFARDVVIRNYWCGSDGSAPGKSNYVTILSKSATKPSPVFTKGAEVTFAEITDGSSNTILVVETVDSVQWVAIDDLAFETMPMAVGVGAEAKGISSFHFGGSSVVMADGSQKFLPETIDDDVLKALITRDGGETPFMGF